MFVAREAKWYMLMRDLPCDVHKFNWVQGTDAVHAVSGTHGQR